MNSFRGFAPFQTHRIRNLLMCTGINDDVPTRFKYSVWSNGRNNILFIQLSLRYYVGFFFLPENQLKWKF